MIIPFRPSIKSTTCEDLITTAFVKSVISPTRTKIFVKSATVVIPSRPTLKPTTHRESMNETVMKYSIDSQQTTIVLTITTEAASHNTLYNTYSTETLTSTWQESVDSVVGNLRPQITTIIGGVLGAVVVIVGILITLIVIVVVNFCKKRRKGLFDLTTNEAYTERALMHARLIDEDHNNDAIEVGTSNINEVPMEQNAAYVAKSLIQATTNVAYENTSEFYEYDYI